MEQITIPGTKRPRFVRWAVMVGIVVVLNLFFFVVRSLVFPAPQYEDYCAAAVINSNPQDAKSCTASGGTWNTAPTPKGQASSTEPAGYCDMMATCQPAYQKAYDQYQLYSFVIEVGLGLLALIAGVVPLGSSIVSTGLSYGGVVAFVVAAAQYWNDAGSWLRLAISLIALVALIYIGLKRFRD